MSLRGAISDHETFSPTSNFKPALLLNAPIGGGDDLCSINHRFVPFLLEWLVLFQICLDFYSCLFERSLAVMMAQLKSFVALGVH